MAAPKNKGQCYTCTKHKILYPCNGCSEYYCLDCLPKHRQLLGEQMEEFLHECNRFRQELNEQKQDPNKHLLIEEVNQWEQDSIQKIKAAAKQCRDVLVKHTNKNINDLEKRLTELAEQIRTVHRDSEYDETDLNQFKLELENLEKELNRPSYVSIQKESTPLIYKISIVSSPTEKPEKVTVSKKETGSNIHQVNRSATIRSIADEFDIDYTKDQMSTSKIKPRSENNADQFAAPGRFNKLGCEGRHCVNCGKCRDWYFTGDPDTWKWIRNVKNWTENDKTRWDNGDYYKLFKERDGATCRLLLGHLYHHYAHACVCADNVNN